MRCQNCKRKGICIQCSCCKDNFCTACIQLEVHQCKELKVKIDKDLKRLEQSTPCIQATKLQAI